jgi:hypothetical protein
MRSNRSVLSKTFAALVVAGSIASLAALPAAAATATYYPSGPQVNVPLIEVTNGGWALCWSEDYNLVSKLEDIVAGTDDHSAAACDGDMVLITGWENANPNTLITLAAAPREEAFLETPMSDVSGALIPRAADGWASVCRAPGSEYTNPHLVNGTYWYNTPGCSMGITPTEDLHQWPGDSMWNDGTQSKRISWHMFDGANPTSLNGGFSLGELGALNGSSAHTRAVFTASQPVTPPEENTDPEIYQSGVALADTGSTDNFPVMPVIAGIALMAAGWFVRRSSK